MSVMKQSRQESKRLTLKLSLVNILHHYLLTLQYNKKADNTARCVRPGVVTSGFKPFIPDCDASLCYRLVCSGKHLQQRKSLTRTAAATVLSLALPLRRCLLAVHPTNINRACPHTHSCSDAQPKAEAGKQTEACSHEKRAMLSLLSSSPAGPRETQKRCRNDRCISTIHRADGVGVKLCNLLFTCHSPAHTHTNTSPHSSQSYSIKSHHLSYEEGQKHQRSKLLVDVLGGNFIMSLCCLAGFICQ